MNSGFQNYKPNIYVLYDDVKGEFNISTASFLEI